MSVTRVNSSLTCRCFVRRIDVKVKSQDTDNDIGPQLRYYWRVFLYALSGGSDMAILVSKLVLEVLGALSAVFRRHGSAIVILLLSRRAICDG